MTSCLMCYVMEVSTTYGLQLGRPWIHENHVVPSTLLQFFKYVGEDLKVHTHFTDMMVLHRAEKDNMDQRANKNKEGIVLEKKKEEEFDPMKKRNGLLSKKGCNMKHQ